MAKLGARDEARRAGRDMGEASPADYSEALERGLLVLSAFDGEAVRLTQADLSRRLGLPRATVRRAALTLVHMGYLEVDQRAYRLTPKVLELASTYLTANPVSTVLQPVCERLCDRFDASSTVAVLDGPDAVMVARAVPRQSIGFGHGVGFRVPAVRSALGQALLAGLPEDERHAYLARHVSAADVERVGPSVTEVADRGYAYVADDVEVGFHSLAVPLRRWDGRTVAALNVGCRVEHLVRDAMVATVLPELLDVAGAIRRRLV